MDKNAALQAIVFEYERASKIFGPFLSAHEGLAIIEEEFEELRQEVYRRRKLNDDTLLRSEAIQLGAMAMRFLVDIT